MVERAERAMNLSLRRFPVASRGLAALGLGVLIGLSPLRPAAADDAEALARALADMPFDQSTLDQGYRWLETVTGAMPAEAAEHGVVAGAAATFQRQRELYRDAVAVFLVFATPEQASDYYDLQFPIMQHEHSGPSAVVRATVITPDGEELPCPCFVSTTDDTLSCMYLEYELATVIQMVAGPGPGFDPALDADGLENEFILGDAALVPIGILPAALSHLLRAAGE
jgi:hypothetical protein